MVTDSVRPITSACCPPSGPSATTDLAQAQVQGSSVRRATRLWLARTGETLASVLGFAPVTRTARRWAYGRQRPKPLRVLPTTHPEVQPTVSPTANARTATMPGAATMALRSRQKTRPWQRPACGRRRCTVGAAILPADAAQSHLWSAPATKRPPGVRRRSGRDGRRDGSCRRAARAYAQLGMPAEVGGRQGGRLARPVSSRGSPIAPGAPARPLG